MIILPAIDIKDGQCVRLFKGDFGTAEKVAENPYDTAESFFKSGAEWIHMVDLDGAKKGVPVNTGIFKTVAKTKRLKTEVGGGIRNMDTIEMYLESGIERVILGSAALSDPRMVKEAAYKYGTHIAVGIDARSRMVAAEGWLDTSSVDFIELAKQMESIGIACIIFTDISKDGTLAGPNLEQLEEIGKAVSCDIVASGGIADIGDIRALCRLNLYGAICGKSIYGGSLSLAEAITVANQENQD